MLCWSTSAANPRCQLSCATACTCRHPHAAFGVCGRGPSAAAAGRAGAADSSDAAGRPPRCRLLPPAAADAPVHGGAAGQHVGGAGRPARPAASGAGPAAAAPARLAGRCVATAAWIRLRCVQRRRPQGAAAPAPESQPESQGACGLRAPVLCTAQEMRSASRLALTGASLPSCMCSPCRPAPAALHGAADHAAGSGGRAAAYAGCRLDGWRRDAALATRPCSTAAAGRCWATLAVGCGCRECRQPCLGRGRCGAR